MTVSVEGGSPVGLAMLADTIPVSKPKVTSVEQEAGETMHPAVRQTSVVTQLDVSERKQTV